MRKYLVAIQVVLVSLLVIAPVSANNPAPKLGSSCSKSGQSVTTNGKKYVCSKAISSKKLLWTVVIATPTKKPEASTTSSTSSSTIGQTAINQKLPFDVTKPRANQPCQARSSQVIGYGPDIQTLMYLSCSSNGYWQPSENAPLIDQATGLPSSISSSATSTSKNSGQATTRPLDPSKPKQGDACTMNTPSNGTNADVIGYNSSGTLVMLACSPGGRSPRDFYSVPINQSTGEFIPAPIVGDSPVFNNQCETDPLVPSEWAELQAWSMLNMDCAFPLRYVPGNTNFGEPSTPLTATSNYLPIQSCKLNDGNSNNPIFPRPSYMFTPSKNTVIQVVPVEFSDYQTLNSPTQDYGKYFEFGADWLKNSSDLPVNAQYRVPDHYLQMPGKYSDYDIGPHVDIHNKFYTDLIAQVGTSINMQGVAQVLIVIAPTTPATWRTQWGQFGTNQPQVLNFQTGQVDNFYLMASSFTGQLLTTENLPNPLLMIHEEFGHDAGLNDEYGTEPGAGNQLHQPNSGSNFTAAQLGTGLWGNMSMWHTELLIWDKWLIGYEADSQIACLPPKSSSTVWLRPSTTKGTFLKAAVIPVSPTKVVVVESERSTGYNFKLPTNTNGALVYTVDISKMAGESQFTSGEGYMVIRPSSRQTPPSDENDFIYGDATLKQGESVDIDGVTIKNVEFGDFGDVVTISPK